MNDMQWKSELSPNVLYYNLWYHIEQHLDEESKNELETVIRNIINYNIKSVNNKTKLTNKVITDEEFVEVISIEDKLVVVGYDDAGQCYFIVYNEDGELKSESCGSFNDDYKEIIVYKFGNQLKCEHRSDLKGMEECVHRNKGYCDSCEHYEPREYAFQKLLELGILDRRGNITDNYKDILKVVENS